MAWLSVSSLPAYHEFAKQPQLHAGPEAAHAGPMPFTPPEAAHAAPKPLTRARNRSRRLENERRVHGRGEGMGSPIPACGLKIQPQCIIRGRIRAYESLQQ